MPSLRSHILVDLLRDPEKREKIIECQDFSVWKSREEEFTSYDLHKKAVEHLTFILMVFMRFRDTFKDSIDKYLCVDILRFLPTGSLLHFKDETIRCLSAEKILFNFSTFKNTTFDNCHLCHAFFRNSTIEDCKFEKCCIEDGDFSDSDITNTTFHKVNLTLAMFSSAELRNVNFDQVWMERINFDSYKVNRDRNTLLDTCNFEKCEMSEALFTRNIELYESKFDLCNLCYAKFSEGIFGESNYLTACGVRGIEMADDEYFNPDQVSEIDWLDDIRGEMWDFAAEGHLPHTGYSHDFVHYAPVFYLGPPEF